MKGVVLKAVVTDDDVDGRVGFQQSFGGCNTFRADKRGCIGGFFYQQGFIADDVGITVEANFNRRFCFTAVTAGDDAGIPAAFFQILD